MTTIRVEIITILTLKILLKEGGFLLTFGLLRSIADFSNA